MIKRIRMNDKLMIQKLVEALGELLAQAETNKSNGKGTNPLTRAKAHEALEEACSWLRVMPKPKD